MADTKISSLTALTGADTDTAADVLAIVDTSVTTTKKMLVDELAVALASTQAEVNAMTSTNTLITPALNKIILGTEVATTSGTAVDYTGFPAGVRRITIMLGGVSLNGTTNLLIQLGDSGGFETSGYVSTAVDTGATAVTSTAGFLASAGADASSAMRGTYVLNLEDSSDFTWVGSGTITRDVVMIMAAGVKSLSAELTQLRITTVNGTSTFDSGVVNISYER